MAILFCKCWVFIWDGYENSYTEGDIAYFHWGGNRLTGNLFVNNNWTHTISLDETKLLSWGKIGTSTWHKHTSQCEDMGLRSLVLFPKLSLKHPKFSITRWKIGWLLVSSSKTVMRTCTLFLHHVMNNNINIYKPLDTSGIYIIRDIPLSVLNSVSSSKNGEIHIGSTQWQSMVHISSINSPMWDIFGGKKKSI